MAGAVKTLQFSEGTTVSAPTTPTSRTFNTVAIENSGDSQLSLARTGTFAGKAWIAAGNSASDGSGYDRIFFADGASGPDTIRFDFNVDAGNLAITGALSKGSGSFVIPHPDPKKNATHMLRHCFVESPTAGDNIYRFKIESKAANEIVDVELPDYWQHLNENPQVWIAPIGGFGRAWGEVIDDKILRVYCDSPSQYSVLLIGTRKDEVAQKHWLPKGVEYEKDAAL
jgi:hypothetical protein